MSEFLSFAQALELKIRSQIEKEMHSSTYYPNNERVLHPSFESLIMPIKIKLNFTPDIKAQAQKAYKVTKRPSNPIVLSDTQINALNELNLLGAGLQNPFTKKQLKKVSRKLSLQFHPDQGGTVDQFIKIMDWVRTLEKCAL
jgi:hypothetical protein